MSGGQVFMLVLAGIVCGAALVLLLIGGLGNLGGDDSGTGCLGLGGMLLMIAIYVAIRVLVVG